MAGCPRLFSLVSLSSPDDVAPVPVSALYTQGLDRVDVTFDKPLQAGSGLSGGAWELYSGVFPEGTRRLDVSSVDVSGFVVTIDVAPSDLEDEASEAVYDGTDPLLRGVNGLPVAAFGIPLLP